MRLLVDAHVFDGKFQGTRTYLEGIYRNMVKYQDVDFYFAAQDIDHLKACFGEGRNIHYVPLTTESRIKRLAFEIPQVIRKYKIDYAHFQYISPWIKCCKEIVTIHDLLFMEFPQYFSKGYILKNKLLFRRSAKRADILLTVSEYSKNSISHLFKVPSDSIYATPNAVLPINEDIAIPDVKEKFGIDKYILTVSRIEPRKNHLMLLKAFVELRLADKGYKLVMVGTPDLKYKEFTEYFNSLPESQRRAVISETVSFPELVGLYRQASLFVFPSFAEGFGIPPLEAVEYGCPTLCSNATAMAEFGLPEEWTFDPNDLEELKRKMMGLLQHRPAREDMEKVRGCLKEKYDWPKIADDLYHIIKGAGKQL